MIVQKTDSVFVRSKPDKDARFVYDTEQKAWKMIWTDNPERFIGYRQISGDPVDVFDLSYLIDALDSSNAPPEEKITLKAGKVLGLL